MGPVVRVSISRHRRDHASGIGAVEVLLATGCVLLLAAAFLPQLQGLRERARASGCRENLRRIGQSLGVYHQRHLGLPPGYFPSDYRIDEEGGATWRANQPSYAWSAFLLPQLGYESLHESLAVDLAGLPRVIEHPRGETLLRTPIAEYRCSSDHIGESMDSAPLLGYHRALDRRRQAIHGGAASYVGNGGYFELNHPLYLAPPSKWEKQFQKKTGPNNGVFHVASHLHHRQIADGLSQTIAVGERAWFQGSATWVGTANVRGVKVGDTGMSLGRVWTRINEVPQQAASIVTGNPPVVVDRVNKFLVERSQHARNGFGSYHPGGAHFLMADGSVQFLGNDIDFANTIPAAGANPLLPIPNVQRLGLFQKLGVRNDSLQPTKDSAKAAQ